MLSPRQLKRGLGTARLILAPIILMYLPCTVKSQVLWRVLTLYVVHGRQSRENQPQYKPLTLEKSLKSFLYRAQSSKPGLHGFVPSFSKPSPKAKGPS